MALRRALIVCDVQEDVLKSLFANSTAPGASRAAFLDAGTAISLMG